jgi:hypothetical protein
MATDSGMPAKPEEYMLVAISRREAQAIYDLYRQMETPNDVDTSLYCKAAGVLYMLDEIAREEQS